MTTMKQEIQKVLEDARAAHQGWCPLSEAQAAAIVSWMDEKKAGMEETIYRVLVNTLPAKDFTVGRLSQISRAICAALVPPLGISDASALEKVKAVIRSRNVSWGMGVVETEAKEILEALRPDDLSAYYAEPADYESTNREIARLTKELEDTKKSLEKESRISRERKWRNAQTDPPKEPGNYIVRIGNFTGGDFWSGGRWGHHNVTHWTLIPEYNEAT